MASKSSTASAMAQTFLECIELSEGYTIKPAVVGDWSSPRISFSNEFAQIGNGEQEFSAAAAVDESCGHKSSGEFEFSMSAAATVPPAKCPMLSADELFYKGKLLPLHLPPRIRMVQDLSEAAAEATATAASAKMISRSPALAMMRRERSLKSPARPAFVPSTLKSSSYPPPGYSSRPSSPPKAAKCSGSSRWRDLFGFKKSQASSGKSSLPSSPVAGAQQQGASSKQAPSKFLKMIFNRGSGSSTHTGGTLDHSAGGLGQSSEAMLPLLSRCEHSSNSESEAAAQMVHSSSVSSSSSSSSNWATSSASSSTASTSSFSADFQELPSTRRSNYDAPSTSSSRKSLGNPRMTPRGSPGRRRTLPARPKSSISTTGASHHQAAASKAHHLTRSGSNRRPSSSSSLSSLGGGGRLQLQEHMNKSSSAASSASTRTQSDNWRRPECSKPVHGNGTAGGYSSSVRVTPVLHVPACIGPSLRSVKVHGFRRLFSSSSSVAAASASNKAPDNPVVAVM